MIEDVLAKLTHVRRSGTGWSARCPAHRTHHGSLSVGIGDGRILLYCHASCSFHDILEALSITAADLRCDACPPVISRAKRIGYARRIWDRSERARNTVVEEYWSRARGINLPPPRSVRFYPLLMHQDFGWPFPAQIAGVQDVDGHFAGVQVTWLAADGCDKAPVETPRKIFGPGLGGAIRLAPVGSTLVLCEGLETGLSVMQATSLPVWVTLGTKGLIAVRLPEIVKEVLIGADLDDAGEHAARSAAQRFIYEGRRVRIARPSWGGDFNDLLRGAVG